MINDVSERFDVIKKAYEDYDFKKALEEIMHVSALGNKYMQDKAPWKLMKEDKEKSMKSF